jgi:beta-galactosidase
MYSVVNKKKLLQRKVFMTTRMIYCFRRTILIILLFGFFISVTFGERTEFDRDFSPSESWVKAPESEFRHEICLNGFWQFQPVPIPNNWKPNQGIAPELVLPKADAWETTPIKIPSHWNVNTWGNGRHVGAGTKQPYFPDSVYYPSYPEHWDDVRMAWMKRSFTPPNYWNGKKLLLHFEAVSGMAEIYINGQKTGENFGRFLPFEIDVTKYVRFDQPNEILVGVRSLRLFDKTSEKYSKMRTPYPPGSNMDNIDGIWQDVYLLAVPVVHIDDVFVKPFVHRNTLEVEIVLKNNSDQSVRTIINGTVFPWINKAEQTIINAPEPRWELGQTAVLKLKQNEEIEIPSGQSVTVTLSKTLSETHSGTLSTTRSETYSETLLKTPTENIKTSAENIGGVLKLWSMEEPNLYGLVLNVLADGKKIDTKYTRFGWREFRIVGNHLELNGKPVQLFADLLHPFGAFISSRRYVWSWYSMIKEMHGNAVRPHAQPHPRIYAELADEMGLAVLAETAMFGSSIQLNFEEEIAWERYTEHYKRLILRDRNHPSVFGWSWGNELFAIFIYDKAITPEQTDIWYKKLAEYGQNGMKYDSTRNWFSCDGDEDFRNTMPVWNKHFGHGTAWQNELPNNINKPLMVGEQGGTYYAKPGQLEMFNGGRSYENYRGRNEALAIDVYKNITEIALPKLTFFSPAETAWFGLEHLNFGYNDFSRLPDKNDGVFFTKPFEENKSGVQIERLPPYVATLNPGFDSKLPLFKPLPMFEAQKAALHPNKPQKLPDYPYRHLGTSVSIMSMEYDRVLFLGDEKGELYKRLKAIGVPLVLHRWTDERNRIFVIVDGNSFSGDDVTEIEQSHRTVIIFRRKTEIPKSLEKFLGNTTLVERTATQLQGQYYYTQCLNCTDYYFAEEPEDRQVIKCALDGEILKRGKICFEAAAVDWSLFNDSPESAKCAAVCLYETLKKPSGVAAVRQSILPEVSGSLFVTTIDVIPASPKNKKLWKNILWGVQFIKTEQNTEPVKKKEHQLLLDGPLIEQ